MAVTNSVFSGSHADQALQFFGKVQDPKPGMYGSKFPAPPNGSTFYEMNGDHDLWMYDASERIWRIQTADAPNPDYIFSFTGIKRHEAYLYETWYDSIDYDAAYSYFLNQRDVTIGACSGVRKGPYFGRKFDWMYNHEVEFVVHLPRIQGRNASIGVSGGFHDLTEAFVHSGENSALYAIVPFQIRDGMNEYGVTISMNVVPADKGKNTSVPLEESLTTISALMVNRFILDYFRTAKAASEFMRDHMTIYFPEYLHDMNYEIHWMIADLNETYLVEIIDDQVVLTNVSDRAYMTNFYLSDVTLNADGTVFTPATGDAVLQNGVTEHGSGLERYNLIASRYDSIRNLAGMNALMDELQYTRAYPTSKNPAAPIWYSEFVDGDLKVNSPISDFADIYAAAGAEYSERSRDNGNTWQTVHTSIYDMDKKILHLMVQEHNHVYAFR